MANDDGKDFEGILAGDDRDNFESFLERKVRSCGSPETLTQISDKHPASDVGDMSWSNSSGAEAELADSKGRRTVPNVDGVPVFAPTEVTALSPKTAETLRREAREADEAERAARSKATYEALQNAERRHRELQAIDPLLRDAELERRIVEEIEHLKNDPTPSSRVTYVDEHVPTEKLLQHEVAGHVLIESDGLLEYDEEMKQLYFSDFITHYRDDLGYEEVKANLETIIKQQHRLTRGIKLLRVKLVAGSAAKFRLLAKLSELDRISMAELDKIEREKYHGRRVKITGDGSDKEKKPRAKTMKAGKTPAQRDIDSLLGMQFDEEYITKHLKLKTNKVTGESFWNEASESYLKLALTRV